MERFAPWITFTAADIDIVRFAGIALVTLVVLITAIVILGFVILFRRRGDSGIRPSAAGPTGGASIDELGKRAGSLLVRADDALRDADDELGFAIAQFGADEARGFAEAIAGARAKVAEAFRLKQALDDAREDSPREQREWTLQIIALTERATAALDEQAREFRELRRAEVNAEGTLRDIRARIKATRSRVDSARAALDDLATRYAPSTLAPVTDNPHKAGELLATATEMVDAAAPGISTAGVSSVSASLQRAAHEVHQADQLLDAVDRTTRRLAEADAALATLIAESKDDLVEARRERDSAPDAETGAGIIAAIADVEKVLAAVSTRTGPSDPVKDLDRLGEAIAGLDTALATARNQAERLEHARTALVGTLISAKSQISAARDYIGSRGGGVDARTRLAEAERQLMLAESEADPVEALDTARRAVTHARDADALARFNAMSRD